MFNILNLQAESLLLLDHDEEGTTASKSFLVMEEDNDDFFFCTPIMYRYSALHANQPPSCGRGCIRRSGHSLIIVPTVFHCRTGMHCWEPSGCIFACCRFLSLVLIPPTVDAFGLSSLAVHTVDGGSEASPL